MAPTEDRIRVSARISKELDTRLRQYYASAAQAINEALEVLVAMKEGTFMPSGADKYADGTNEDAGNDSNSNANGANSNAYGTNQDAGDARDLKDRLTDALAQVEFLKGQITIKDNQITAKDNQITAKDNQIEKQAFSLQSVIQENSRLNVKLLPENKEAKKRWWQFW
jgi:uncharacterized protein (DUF3084 family)